MNQSGFQIEHCRTNCPKSASEWNDLLEALRTKLAELNIHEMLEKKFHPILHHHLPKVGLAGCPNGCSQPNIKDFSISGYVTPKISNAPCLECKACARACVEEAISVQPNGISIDNDRCLSCGNCQRVCPSGTLTSGERGWILRIGGRVGRHPRFATLVGKVSTAEEVVEWVYRTMLDYMENGEAEERLTHFLERKTISV